MSGQTAYNKYKKGKLSRESTSQLEGVRFNWAIRKKNEYKKWEARFEKLVAYKDKNGNCSLPQS